LKAVLVDSSVVLDLFTADPVFCESSLACLALWAARGDLLIDDIVYAEVSVGFTRIEDFDRALSGAGFRHAPIPREALFLAGKAYLAYKKRGGSKVAPLPDFIIGAHAAVEGLPLVTRDPRRIRDAYPGVVVIDPR